METTSMWPFTRKPKPATVQRRAVEAASTADERDDAFNGPVASCLSLSQRDALLALARGVIEQSLLLGESAGSEAGGQSELAATVQVSGRFAGVFVTLRIGAGLRGCIGTFQPTTDIASAIAEVARSSLDDPRFRDRPILAAELPDLSVEISLLSDLVRTIDPLSLEPGIHGILIRRGEQSGCFLPNVALERGWNAEAFLSNCCTAKADLPADAWRDPDTEVCLFTVESFRGDPPRLGDRISP